jgi:hypothetical protein
MNKVSLFAPGLLFWALAAHAEKTHAPEPSVSGPAASGSAAPPAGSDQIPVVERGPSGDTVVSGPGSTETAPPASPSPAPSAAPSEPTAHPATSASAAKPAAAEEEPKIPPAHDTLGGHVAVGAAVGVIVPFGSIDSRTAQSDVLSSGLFLGGDIAYGVSRTVMLGAYGEVAMPSATGAESGKDVSSIAAGPLVRYHLVQGMRFDPWLSYGIGFRRTKFGSDSVTGIDWARVVIGGDWYPFDNFGIGPVLELTMGTFFSGSGVTLGDKAMNANFVAGGRIVFDSPGK